VHERLDVRLQLLVGLVMAGVAAVAFFQLGLFLPLPSAVLAFFAVAAAGLATVRSTRLSVLPRVMLVIYALPLTALIPAIFERNYEWWSTPRAIWYMHDDLLMKQLVAIATIGLIGLLIGIELVAVTRRGRRRTVDAAKPESVLRTLPGIVFGMFAAAAVISAWLGSPGQDIFQVRYSAEAAKPRAAALNFNAGYLVANLILVLLVIDAERERASPSQRRRKYSALLAVAFIVVVVLGLLRGHREGAGLVVAMMALYLTGPDPHSGAVATGGVIRRRIMRLTAPAAVIVVVFLAIGSARQTLSSGGGLNPAETISDGFRQNTWSAVLVTNLAATAEYRFGPMNYLHGGTYVDYVESLPPGVVTRAMGVERRIEPTKGPGWWASDLGAFGVDVVVVPFKNFGAIGVLLVLALFGYAIARFDQANRLGSVWRRLLFGAVAASSFSWFWYGDLNAIRAVLVACLLGLVYQLVARPVPRYADVEKDPSTAHAKRA
jgi:hypothetical protein